MRTIKASVGICYSGEGSPFQVVTAGGFLAAIWHSRKAPAALLSNRQSVPMTVSALRGRRLVEEYILALDDAR